MRRFGRLLNNSENKLLDFSEIFVSTIDHVRMKRVRGICWRFLVFFYYKKFPVNATVE